MGDVYKHILVTGGAGFIGSNYVRCMLSMHEGLKITVLDKLTYAGNIENLDDLKDSIKFIHGDIANSDDVSNAMSGVDAVVNFAAESHVDRSLTDPYPFIRTNVEGTLVLLNEAKKQQIGRFLHVSTDEVYGDLAGTYAHSVETDQFKPRSPYSASKAAAEHLVSSYYHSCGVDIVITRGSNTYGPYQYPEKIIPLFITNVIDDKPLPVYGDGSAVRDYMHVTDHAMGIDKVLREGKAGEAYNLGANEEISGIAVAERILSIMNKPKSLISYVTDRPGHDYRYSIDSSKAESIGWNRRWSFDEGMVQTVKWYESNEAWWRKIKEKIEYMRHESQWYARK